MPVIESGSRDEPLEESDRILTLPNLLSLVRLLALPIVYLDLTSGRELRAFIVLTIIVWSDYLDGYVARRFGQLSRIGRLFDPISDRILVAVVGAGMVVGGIIPLWVLVALLARDVAIVIGGAILMRRGIEPPKVSDVGKSATFGLMGVLPLFILAAWLGSAQLRASTWVLLAAFGALYYLAFLQYVVYAIDRLRRPRV